MNSTREKKVKKNYDTNPRRELYLLDKPLSKLPANELPTKGQVVRYLQYLKSPMSCKFISTASHAGCKQGSNTSDLKCKYTVCDGNKRCATSAVIDVWIAAGFQHNIYRGNAVKKQICALHKKFTALLSKKRWTQNSKRPSKKDEESFLEEMDKLFDISRPGVVDKVKNERLSKESAKDFTGKFQRSKQDSDLKEKTDAKRKQKEEDDAVRLENYEKEELFSSSEKDDLKNDKNDDTYQPEEKRAIKKDDSNLQIVETFCAVFGKSNKHTSLVDKKIQFPCNICDKSFSDNSLLAIHQWIHTEVKDNIKEESDIKEDELDIKYEVIDNHLSFDKVEDFSDNSFDIVENKIDIDIDQF